MIKFFGSFFIVLSISFRVLAQSDDRSFGQDETGKYIYYEVVAEQKNPDSVGLLITQFLMQQKLEIKSINTAVGKFEIPKSTSFISHPIGEVAYSFNFETKNGKYRYWLSDFIFTPYKKNRYGNFMPITTANYALENEKAIASYSNYIDLKSNLAEKITAFADNLKRSIKSQEAAVPVVQKKVISKVW